MTDQTSNTLQQYLEAYNLSPRTFSELSGMPLTEVVGILDNRLPMTRLRAHHLSAAFNTELTIWFEPTEPVPQ